MSMITEQVERLRELSKQDKLGLIPWNGYSEILNQAADTIEQLEKGYNTIYYTPKAEWTPVKERLPEERVAVLVWCPTFKNIFCAYLDKEKWWIFGAFSQIVPNEVIAWMPIEPYREDGDTE